MKNVITITIFTVAITLFYRHVGQLVPQKEVPAPETMEVGENLTTDEMVPIGEKVVQGKCMSCHGIQPRFPSLDGVGGRAATQLDGYSDVDYLAESLYEPNAFIVEGFAAGMTAANKPPINLTDKEVLTVIAYLQSLGGTPSVTMDTTLKYQSADGGESSPASTGADTEAAPSKEMSAEEIFAQFACVGCHSTTSPDPGAGPSLYDIGKRQSKGEIYEAIMDPDATIAEGYYPGVMGATLQGVGFYAKVSSGDLKKLVDYLASLKGEEPSEG